MGKMRILVTDEIDPEGVELLRAEPTLMVDERPTLPAGELVDIIGTYDAFVGRSATRLPADLLHKAHRLRVIGRAGVGTDNIDIPAATSLGIAIINAPAGNTVSVAELFFGSILSLVRHIPRAVTSMSAGAWDRSLLLGTELRGRTLGIVGLGRIGSEIAVRARAFEMNVIAFDPYVTDERFESLRVARARTMHDLLPVSHIVTVHTPLTTETKGILGTAEMEMLPKGAIVANMARGGIVDEHALIDALTSGRLGGALLDVFTKEPLPADHRFRSMENVILTPHLGASTAEGQRNVAVDVCAGVRDALLTGALSGAINVLGGSRAQWDDMQPAVLLARRTAAIARALLAESGGTAIEQMTVRIGRDLAGADTLLLSAAAAGVLDAVIERERLNLVNARSRAEERGIILSVAPAAATEPAGYVQVTVRCGSEEITVAGVASPGSGPRLTRIGAFNVDVTPRRTLLILTNADVPGVIGKVGTLLGNAGVNIAEYHQARMTEGGEALAAVSLDGAISHDVRRQLMATADVRTATVVNFAELDAGGERSWR